MKLGWCGPIENAPIIANAGLDFIEVPLAPLGLEERASFAAAKKAVTASPLPTLAFNLFLPSDMRVVGADGRMANCGVARPAGESTLPRDVEPSATRRPANCPLRCRSSRPTRVSTNRSTSS